MYRCKSYIKVLILLLPGFFLVNSLKLLAIDYDGSNVQTVIPKDNSTENIQSVSYADYYVSKNGDDNNSGKSPESAWKTIAKVNAHFFIPGDRIHFRRGDEWREQLTVSSSGTETQRITFSAYGTGAKPIFNGADIKTGWVNTYNNINLNIWGTVSPNATTTRAMVILDNIIYSETATLAELTSANKYWIKTASTPDSLYVYSTTDPDALTAEVSKRDYGIYAPDANNIKYVNFTYLDIRYAGTTGLGLYGTEDSQTDGYCIVDSCNFYANRLHSCVAYDGHSNDIFRNSTATYNGNGFYSWVSDNLTISNCSSAHNISYLIAPGTTDGHGYGLYDSDNCIVQNCESYDDGDGIVIDANSNGNGATIRYNEIHDSKTGTTGISVSRLGTGATIEVYYNLIVNCGGATGSGSSFDSWIANTGQVLVYNNTMYNNSSNGGNSTVMLAYGDNVVLKNNIIVSEFGNWKFAYYVNDGKLATSDYNQFYSTGVNANWFSYYGTAYSSLANWQAGVSQDANSQSGDPLFVNKASNWTLQAGSPCINKGTVIIGIPQTDILGHPIVGLPDIGAFEAQLSSNIPLPVYLNSKVENVKPVSLEMTYNLNLANILPSVSAFTVLVNSTARTVSSVAISGTKVILTLSSPVAAGNVVTVAYNKPSANPLQTTAGGQAATIGAQTVTNKVEAANAPPVVVVNSTQTILSGFVSELDATGSYDPDNDNLSFTWVAPGNISVSSTTSQKIQFLSPIVNSAQKVDFTLHLGDGKTTQSKVIQVEILPYKPELAVAEVLTVEASGFQSPNYPHNILDGNIGTMWAVDGNNQWLILELKEPFNIQHVKLGFKPGQNRESYFDILGSGDKLIWEPILLKSASCSFSGDIQVFEFPSSKSLIEFKFVKLVGQSNSLDSWNHISEFKIFGYKYRNPLSYEEQPVKIYPNPALDYINIRIDEPSMAPDLIEIISLSGNIVYQEKVNPDIREFQIPINFTQGIYIVQLQSNNLILFAQDLIVQ
jgi:uncharacterized repeat protein (TIGR02059 family)